MKRQTLLGVTVLTVGLRTLVVAAGGRNARWRAVIPSTRLDAPNAR